MRRNNHKPYPSEAVYSGERVEPVPEVGQRPLKGVIAGLDVRVPGGTDARPSKQEAAVPA